MKINLFSHIKSLNQSFAFDSECGLQHSSMSMFGKRDLRTDCWWPRKTGTAFGSIG